MGCTSEQKALQEAEQLSPPPRLIIEINEVHNFQHHNHRINNPSANTVREGRSENISPRSSEKKVEPVKNKIL